MPLTSITKDAGSLSFTVVGDYPVTQQRLWDAFADPRQLERFWGPPEAPVTFTSHDFTVGGRAEYVMADEKFRGSWRFTAVNPISSFEAVDGDDNVDDEFGPSEMALTFTTTETGSRVTVVIRFSSLEALEKTGPDMQSGMRAALPQLDTLLTEDV